MYTDIISGGDVSVRLKASYTIEASYIVPLFTIIVVVMINLMLMLHDYGIYRCTSLNYEVIQEFDKNKVYSNSEYEKKKQQYLSERMILEKRELNLEASKVIKMNMVEIARISRLVGGIAENGSKSN